MDPLHPLGPEQLENPGGPFDAGKNQKAVMRLKVSRFAPP